MARGIMNREMRIEGLSELKSISCQPVDIENKINEKNREKRAYRMAMNKCQTEINDLLILREKLLKQEEFKK